jgi:hypothetical protein
MVRMRPPKRNTSEEDSLIPRHALARRWACHVETIRRREKAGQLHPIQIGERMIRYKMREVLEIEREAATQVKSRSFPGRLVKSKS